MGSHNYLIIALCQVNENIGEVAGLWWVLIQLWFFATKEQGWRIRAIAVLGQNAGGLKAGNLRQLPQAGTNPINITASEVRALFNWR